MTDEFLINNKLTEIRDKIISILDYDRYEYKHPTVRSTQLWVEINPFINLLKSDLQGLTITDYSYQQLSDLIAFLNNKYTQTSFKDIPLSFIKARNGLWPLVKEVLDAALSKMAEELLSSTNSVIIKRDDNILNSYQIALLIIYLRDSKIIPYRVTEKTVVECFEKLTGYSKDNLRNLASKKHEKNQITEIERNYDELISVLNQIITKIEADKKSSVLKKGRRKVIK